MALGVSHAEVRIRVRKEIRVCFTSTSCTVWVGFGGRLPPPEGCIGEDLSNFLGGLPWGLWLVEDLGLFGGLATGRALPLALHLFVDFLMVVHLIFDLALYMRVSRPTADRVSGTITLSDSIV